jgi:hypothetical protein
MLRRVALVKTDVSEEHIAFIIRVTASSPIIGILMMEPLSSSETPVITRTTRPNIPEDGILQRFKETEGSVPCSEEAVTGPYQ